MESITDELLTGLEEHLAANRALDLAYAKSIRAQTLVDFEDSRSSFDNILDRMFEREVASAGLSDAGEQSGDGGGERGATA